VRGTPRSSVESVAAAGGIATALVAVASATAYLLTRGACGGDGSFDALTDPGSRRSAYCVALHLPGSPAGAGSLALTVALFALPLLICVALTLALLQRSPSRASVTAGGLLLAASFVMVAFASADYVGGI